MVAEKVEGERRITDWQEETHAYQKVEEESNLPSIVYHYIFPLFFTSKEYLLIMKKITS